MKKKLVATLLTLALLMGAGCGRPKGDRVTMRVGYFPNLTHAQAMIGAARGDFEKALPEGVQVDYKVFNAGPSAIEALFAGALDLTYVGPNPAINGYLKSKGQALRVVAGACSGGAVFVVRPEANIQQAADLAGKHLASPQLGNTQDVALRDYLDSHGLKTSEQGGTVRLTPIANPDILTLFLRGELDGAWVPEPWGARLVHEAKAVIFIDERRMWPDGQFTTAIVVAGTKFLKTHPELVDAWLRVHVELTEWIRSHPEDAKVIANDEIRRLTGKSLPRQVIDDAFSRMSITYDPLRATIDKMALGAYRAGFLGPDRPDLKTLCDLTALSRILAKMKLPPIK